MLTGPSPLRVAASADKSFLQMDDANLVAERSLQAPAQLPYLDRICGRYFTAVLLTRSLSGQ